MVRLFILIVVILLILALMFRATKKSLAYRCPKCGEEFTNSFWMELITIDVFGFSLVRCPKCKKWSFTPLQGRRK